MRGTLVVKGLSQSSISIPTENVRMGIGMKYWLKLDIVFVKISSGWLVQVFMQHSLVYLNVFCIFIVINIVIIKENLECNNAHDDKIFLLTMFYLFPKF